MHKLLPILLFTGLFFSCSEPKVEENPELPLPRVDQGLPPEPSSTRWYEEKTWNSIIDDAKLVGSVLIFDAQNNSYHGTNLSRVDKGFLPASTFKIPNSMIALETGVIKDLEQVIKWDGEDRRMDSWEQDMNLRMAYRRSCLPCYQQLAREIGLDRMQEMVGQLGYPGMDIREETLDDFWVVGESRISQSQQINFLKLFYEDELRITPRTKSLMLEIMEHESTSNYTMYAKTGWAIREDGSDLGWFVGFVTRGNDVWYFATNVQPGPGLNRDDFARLRIQVTKSALRKMGVITETLG